MLLKFAVQDFIDDREFKNLSETTIKSYREILGQFQQFCNESEVMNLEDITPNIVKKFITHYQKKGNNAVTTNTKLQGVIALLNYMVEIEVIVTNPAKKIPKAKVNFNDYHIRQMLNYYRRIKQREKAFWAYRDYTIIIHKRAFSKYPTRFKLQI